MAEIRHLSFLWKILISIGRLCNSLICFIFRKKGKLPGECFETSYELEYGSAEVEIQKVGFREHGLKKALIVDDLLATGGTMEAAVKLIKQCGATAGMLKS